MGILKNEIINTSIKLYKELNPKKAIKSPKVKPLRAATKDNYGVRWFKKSRYKDIQTLVTIDRQDILYKKMLPKSASKLKYFRDVLNSSENYVKYKFFVFGITDIKNEIIGWVQFTEDENKKNLKKMIKIERGARIYEVSYAKLFTRNLKGVILNGLKNTLELFRKIDNNDSYDLYITGYTDSKNIASEFVLNSNRFTKLNNKILYDGEYNNIWVKKIN